MWDVRRELEVKSLRWKIEQKSTGTDRSRDADGRRTHDKSGHSRMDEGARRMEETEGKEAEDHLLLEEITQGMQASTGRI